MFVDVKRATYKPVSVPSPVGGINAYDNLASMPETDAVSLENWVPQPFGCTMRRGYQERNTGLLGPVNTIGNWPAANGVIKAFAWAGSWMYDITAPGAVGAALLTGLSTSWWQTVNFGNSGGTHMIAFSGADNPIWYSNAGVQRLVAGNGSDNGTISNIDPITWIQGTVHQRRLWAVQVNSTIGWYLPTDSIYGTANFFDFGPLFKRGGYLVCLATWTVDSGDGSNDKLVAISSMGEAAVFSGLDVNNASTWDLDGIYFVGSPVRGRRIFTNVGGDLLVLTTYGVVSMASLVTSTQVNTQDNAIYSKKIQFLLSELTNDLGQLDGWEIKFVPALNFLMINIPSVYATGNGQLVSNLVNQTWCTFNGYDAQTFSVIQDKLYFGGDNGRVYQAWVANKDNIAQDGSGGRDIIASAQQAYSYLQSPGTQKQIGMYRLCFLLARKIGYNSKVTYDFKAVDPGYPTGAVSKSKVALWNNAIWNKDRWSGGPFSQLDWRMAEGMGVAASLVVSATSQTETIWISTDFTFQGGGPL